MPMTPFWAQRVDPESALFTIVFAVAIPTLIVIIGYTLVKLGQRAGMRKAREEDAALRLARREGPPPKRVNGFVWVVLIFVFAITFYFAGKKENPDTRQPRRAGNPPEAIAPTALICPAIGLLFVAYLAFAAVRSYDHAVSRGLKKLNSGDAEGALEDISRAIEKKRTANRLNVLACVLIDRKQFHDAHKALTEAQSLGLEPLVYQTNLAVILRGLGRPEEALGLIELQVRRPSASLAEVIAYCEILMDLKRLDAAGEQLGRAEAMFAAARNGKGPRDANGIARRVLDRTRDRLSAMVEKPGVSDDEV